MDSRAALKLYFETGDKPTQSEFAKLIEALYDNVVIAAIQTVGTNNFTATVAGVTEYNVSQTYRIKFDANIENGGDVTVKINALAAKIVFLEEGAELNIQTLQPNVYYDFIYNGTAFVFSARVTIDTLLVDNQELYFARLATNAALNDTPLYDNGTNGVGATLTGAGVAALGLIDGVAPEVDDNLLIKDEGDPATHGLYSVTDLGDDVTTPYILTRVIDCDVQTELDTSVVFVAEGSVAPNANTYWAQKTVLPIVGTDAIVYEPSAATRSKKPNVIYCNGISARADIDALATFARVDSGLNDTWTADANGAFPDINGVTARVGKRYLLVGSSGTIIEMAANGIYVLVKKGTASTPFVLKRAPEANQKSELYPLLVFVTQGNAKDKILAQITKSPVVGVSPLLFVYTNTDGIQYETPATGDTVTARTFGSENLVIDPATNLDSLNINFPATPLINGQRFDILITKAVKIMAMDGDSLNYACSANQSFSYKFSNDTGTWIQQNGNWGGYRKYVALISQIGTADPTVTILENTIGDIVWTRDGVGEYFGTLGGVFPAGKVWCSVDSPTVANFAALMRRTTNDRVDLTVCSPFSTGLSVAADGGLDKTHIEIRLYR